jgi:hypothetical protein
MASRFSLLKLPYSINVINAMCIQGIVSQLLVKLDFREDPELDDVLSFSSAGGISGRAKPKALKRPPKAMMRRARRAQSPPL